MKPTELFLSLNTSTKDQSGIYLIYCSVSGKGYIGQTKSKISKRWSQHRLELKNNRHTNSHLQSSYNKYGPESLQYKALENCALSDLTEREGYYLGLLDKEFIINQKGVTDSFKSSEEYKQKMSNRVITEETRMKISRTMKEKGNEGNNVVGHAVSEATREKISAANRGMKVSKGTVIKRLETKKKNGKVYNNKLNIDQVREIKLALSNNIGCAELGKKYGVSRLTISSIKRGDSWKGV